MKIAVMGYGTIGSGVVEVLEINKEKIAKRAGERRSIRNQQRKNRKESGRADRGQVCA